MANDIVVSIYCTAYNHEKYIEKTLLTRRLTLSTKSLFMMMHLRIEQQKL